MSYWKIKELLQNLYDYTNWLEDQAAILNLHFSILVFFFYLSNQKKPVA